jgi:hypothetical protein
VKEGTLPNIKKLMKYFTVPVPATLDGHAIF